MGAIWVISIRCVSSTPPPGALAHEVRGYAVTSRGPRMRADLPGKRRGLVFAAIAPHGGLAIAEACSRDERMLAAATRAGMEELGRLFAAARPEAVIVATPPNVPIANALGAVVAGPVAGRLAGAPPSVALDVPSAHDLASLRLHALPPAPVAS